MDTLLVAVTALSLLIVLGLAAIVVHLWRQDQRRSHARVAALVAMSGQAEIEHQPEPVRAPDPSVHATERPLRAALAPPVRAAAPEPIAQIDDFELQPSRSVAAAPLFVQPEPSSAWKPRIAIVAPLALMLIGAAIAFYPTQGDIGAPEPAAAPANSVVRTAAPLELLSLKHTQVSDTLTVSGLVQNPRTGAPLSRVFATAFVFAADGTFLASGRAPLDFTALGPGDESPFVVAVPVKGEVARYRVGFRSEDGRVVAHVDRRSGGTIARVNE